MKAYFDYLDARIHEARHHYYYGNAHEALLCLAELAIVTASLWCLAFTFVFYLCEMLGV